ncbi:uncharacterized protein LOC111263366 isoform X2 [Varroa jacobsoni]|uniref:uncharacterized protein LOC111263366 isoform X2 n=1 Tax=Varroa jacobsoni TaxID=62625 RepID=UPI000BF92A7C|nr:uncharacterized protein LOC111263366 isoform X2 [Varroa jacobsoni]
MRQLFVASVALLVVQEALSYGTVRRRQKQPYLPPPPPPQDRISTQYYPASHNFRSTDVHHILHDAQHSAREQAHSHVTHHVAPVVRTHVHHHPPIEVLRTTKTIYQPPDIVHRTVDYEHHDHVTTHYPGSTQAHTHTDYYPAKTARTHTQSVDDKVSTNRKATEAFYDDTRYDHHHHHDTQAHFGRVPTGNAIVTSYFNFPGSGRSDNAFQAPAPPGKIDYRPARAYNTPAYSPLQAQSIEDGDDDDVPQPAPTVKQKPHLPVYERISSSVHSRTTHVPYYTGKVPETKSPTKVFPLPPSTRPSDSVIPPRYPMASFISANRRRPEPLQLNEKEIELREKSRESKEENDDKNESAIKKNPPLYKPSPIPRSFPFPEPARQHVQDTGTQTNPHPQNLNQQTERDPNKLPQNLNHTEEDLLRPTTDLFNKHIPGKEFNSSEQDLKSATQERSNFVSPSRYSLEQVPTASLRYHNF